MARPVGSRLTPASPCLPALPVTFKQKLRNVQVEEGGSVTLSCEVSKADVPAEWRRGGELLENGDKFQMKQRERTLELTIRDLDPEDSGVYTCVCRDQRTKATVKVVGRFSARSPPPPPPQPPLGDLSLFPKPSRPRSA